MAMGLAAARSIASMALSVVRDLRDELEAEGVEIRLARLKTRVQDLVTRIHGVSPDHV